MIACHFDSILLRFLGIVSLGCVLSSCSTTRKSAASGEAESAERPSFFKSKRGAEANDREEVCVEPDFEPVTMERTIPASLLRPPTGQYRFGPGDELDIEVAEDS